MLTFSWDIREDLELAKPWAMRKSHGVTNWKVQGMYQLPFAIRLQT